MNIEYEATFTNINKDQLRSKLKQVDAKLIRPEFFQKRVTFNLPKGYSTIHKWARVRDEGDKITMSFKQAPPSNNGKIDEQKEICVEINDFKQGVELLKALGCQEKSYQETKRELWVLNDVEIAIDEWPYLEPFVEVEGRSEKVVKMVSKKIGLDYSQAKFCAIGQLYQEKYGICLDDINNRIPRITFHDPNPFEK